ncbi:MAG: bacillithiol biosynthesis deacetylase BshB1 [Planctomycetes bacterium]|nr:bacillithiol biosynthesis deacetylase BshB1 [Planctomycetota bacterium]
MGSVDILAFGAHPDDVELTSAGFLLASVARGRRVAVVDATRGEMGTRGTADLRAREAEEAARRMGLVAREGLGFPDGRLVPSLELRDALIAALRRWRPTLVLAPHVEEPHPDHAVLGRAVLEAAYPAGFHRYPVEGSPHRPRAVFHYLSRRAFQPSLIVDISPWWEAKLEVVRCYRSQFHDAASREPATGISSEDFLPRWEGTHRHWGGLIGARYGEAYHSMDHLPVPDPVALFEVRP